MKLDIIARIHTDFPEKFGLPRQSGLTDLTSLIVFEKEYRVEDALSGIDEYSHLWLIWGFSLNKREKWRPTVRPPRLGGNKRMGVFATRSPYRPNPLGLSSVRLVRVIREGADAPALLVEGADLANGTPIYDIKPYLPYTDCHSGASGGFAHRVLDYRLRVDYPENLLCLIPKDKRQGLLSVLSQDPRPSYQDDPQRIYGMDFAEFEIKFKVSDGVLTVTDTVKKSR